MRPSASLYLAALASVFSPSVGAAGDAPATADEIVVTASRSSEALADTLAPVTVITREDIERQQALDVQDLFVGLPGLGLASNGGPGKSASLFVRGTESDHVLVLIDGIKVGSATTGSTPFEQIPIDQIERIEIVRGPRSSLYGSEALGGVIQIFTRRGSRQGLTHSFAIGGGSRGDDRLEAGLRGSRGAFGYSLGLSERSTDGIDVRPGVNEPDKDGYENRAGSARASYAFDSGAELAASYLLVNSRNDFDGSYSNQGEAQNQVLGTTLRLSPLAAWQLGLSAGQSRDESDSLKDGVFKGRFNTRRDHYSWQNDVGVAQDQTVSLGLDYQDDRIDSSTAYAQTSRDNTGVFVQYRGEFGAHEFQASLRQDDNEQFHRHQTGGAAYGYRFTNGLRAGASYGTAFKAPSFNELYYPGYGNPDLEPEKARNIELSLGSSRGRYPWSLNAFRTGIEDLIAFDADLGAPDNIDRALIRGVEAQLGTRRDGLRLQTYLTWLQPENDAGGANDGNILPRRRERSARLDLDYELRTLSVGMTLFGASAGYDNIANTQPLAGYTTLALRAGWQLLPQWQLQLEGRNVLDRDYETAATYAIPGASIFATLRFTPSRS